LNEEILIISILFASVPYCLWDCHCKGKNARFKFGRKIFEIDKSDDLSKQVKKQKFIQALEDSTDEEKTEYLEEVGERVQNTLSEVDVQLGENKEIDLGMGRLLN